MLFHILFLFIFYKFIAFFPFSKNYMFYNFLVIMPNSPLVFGSLKFIFYYFLFLSIGSGTAGIVLPEAEEKVLAIKKGDA